MTVHVLVVDDRLHSAAALVSWLTGGGAKATASATWAEAADTLAYQQLAGSALPGLLIGPLAKDGVTVLADLRAQGIDVPTAFYTESKSRDQDETLARQYRLIAILHKPFAEEDCSRLLGMSASGGAAAAPADDLIGSTHLSREEPPPIPTSAPPPLAAPRSAGATVKKDVFDDLIGSSRGSSVRADAPPPKAKTLKAEELPSGVQRLLVDPMAEGQKGAAAKGPAEDAAASGGPRPVSILAVEDKFGSARLLVERLGAPGQTTRAAASYAEALLWLERLMQGSGGCDLVIGPLSADGVAAVREYRRRGWQNHVVFYTESSSQSQDPRLPAQYGCLAIVRRSGMVEQLERLVADLRSKPRQPAAVPGEAGSRTASSTRMSGLHAAPEPAPAAAAPPAPAPAAPAPRPASRTSGLFTVPPGAPAPKAMPGAGTGRIESATGVASRVRRSITLPPTNAPAAPAAPPSPEQAPLQIDVGGGDAPPPAAPPRVITCSKCKQEFVATVRPGIKANCPHCGTLA